MVAGLVVLTRSIRSIGSIRAIRVIRVTLGRVIHHSTSFTGSRH